MKKDEENEGLVEQPMRTKLTKEYLKCDFTTDEIREKGKELSDVLGELQSLEDRFKSIKTQIKAEIEEKEARRNKLAEQIRSGYEMRDVDVRISFLYGSNSVTYLRLDNFDTYRTRRMTEYERQHDLPLIES